MSALVCLTAAGPVAADKAASAPHQKLVSSAPLRVGAPALPHAELIRAVLPELLARGVRIDLQTFDDRGLANVALARHELDAVFAESEPYLWRWRTLHPAPLASAGAIYVESMGLYSQKHARRGLVGVGEGALVLLPDDPVELGRALMLLHRSGLLELDLRRGYDATLADVAKNPLRLRLRLDSPAGLLRSLDEADLVALGGNTAAAAGLDPKLGLLREEGGGAFAEVVVALQEGVRDPRLAELVRALRGATVRALLEARFKGAALPVEQLTAGLARRARAVRAPTSRNE